MLVLTESECAEQDHPIEAGESYPRQVHGTDVLHSVVRYCPCERYRQVNGPDGSTLSPKMWTPKNEGEI